MLSSSRVENSGRFSGLMLNNGHVCSYLNSAFSGHTPFIAFCFIGVYSIILIYKCFQLFFEKVECLVHNLKEYSESDPREKQRSTKQDFIIKVVIYFWKTSGMGREN